MLDSAQDLFARKGYDGTSVRAVLAAAGHPGQIALVQHHFGSKLDLYAAVWARTVADASVDAASLGSIAVPAGFPLPQLWTAIAAFLAPPAAIGMTRSGHAFLSIMRQEVADPQAGERGLVARYLAPAAGELEARLGALFPDLAADVRTQILGMVLATAQTFIGPTLGSPEPDPAIIGRRLDAAVSVLAWGILAYAQGSGRCNLQ